MELSNETLLFVTGVIASALTMIIRWVAPKGLSTRTVKWIVLVIGVALAVFFTKVTFPALPTGGEPLEVAQSVVNFVAGLAVYLGTLYLAATRFYDYILKGMIVGTQKLLKK